jgi:hypothetical protein
LEVAREGDRYKALATVSAAGLLDWFVDAEAACEAEGALAAGAPTPSRFDADARFGDDRYRLAMRYDAPGAAPALDAEPPLRERSYDATPDALRGALDPLSAAVAACLPSPEDAVGDRTVAVYDARRRVDVRVGPARPAGDRLRAEAEVVRVAGFKQKHLRRPPFPITIQWDRRDGLATLARVDGATPYGTAVISRRG